MLEDNLLYCEKRNEKLKHLLRDEDGNEEVKMFANHTMIFELRRANRALIDGTFRMVSDSASSQMVTIFVAFGSGDKKMVFPGCYFSVKAS